MIKGIDVSNYQSSFPTSGFDFCFIKATEGRTFTDPKQAHHARRAYAAGMVVGFYAFIWPGNIKAQAAYFVEQCASLPGDILACDWETTSAGTAASCAEKDAFLREVKRLRPGHKVLLYCNRDFWLNRDTTSFAGDGLWIAQYNGKPGEPDIQAPWRFHQYTSDPIDTNLGAFDSREALRAWAGGDNHQEDDVQLNDKLKVGWLKERFPKVEGLRDGEIYVKTALGSGYGWSRIAASNTEQILAQLGAQQATIDKLVDAIGAGDGLTAAEIKAAAEAGAQAALDRLGAALTNDAEGN